ncbi:DeoR/GlpR family DNA-binding transcription regulator [Paenibacillus sp. CECT 9249]|uniref:DeoR/GlpR family DNA-binding transcription regulator n=1 Tax=Paenibacillus sp. CECT 9249 TaxID=2845385 RepID=UPI0033B45D49
MDLASIFAAERQKQILDFLNKKKRATVKELSEILNVSEATLRSDLRTLEKDALVKRTHGGAVLQEAARSEYSFSVREKKNHSEKVAICRKAAELIESGQCILLDGSSTALELARILKKTPIRLTVITNGIFAAMELKDNPELTVILIGGVIRVGHNSLEGTLGTSILNQINVDTMFTSANGFTIEEGLTDFNVYEVELKKEMVAASSRVVALLDHSKIGKNSIAAFAATSAISTIITDSQTPQSMIDRIRREQVETILA